MGWVVEGYLEVVEVLGRFQGEQVMRKRLWTEVAGMAQKVEVEVEVAFVHLPELVGFPVELLAAQLFGHTENYKNQAWVLPIARQYLLLRKVELYEHHSSACVVVERHSSA